MSEGITLVSIFFAGLASVFWIWSASIKVPHPISYYGPTPKDAPEILVAAQVRSKNQIAAVLTGLATFTQALSQIFQTFFT